VRAPPARRGVSRVLSLNLFELLATGGADLHESLRALQLVMRGLELGLHREITGVGLRELGAIDLCQRLTAADSIPEGHGHARHPSRDERCDGHLPIPVRFHHTGYTDAIGRGPGVHGLDLEARTPGELGRDADGHIRQACGVPNRQRGNGCRRSGRRFRRS
jgi:hypothetical protein